MTFATTFARVRDQAMTFEGMMNPLSVAVFQSLLGFQKARGITGDMIEFGVFRGRSASVLLNNLQPGEKAYLVDVVESPEFDKLSAISTQYEFVMGKGDTLSQSPDFAARVPGSFRVSHHDASHRHQNVMAELQFIEPRIAPGGLVILDDFLSPAYLQVVAACFGYLATRDSTLEFLLFANNKAYLCRKADFGYYSRFVFDHLLAEVNSVGMNCQLARTDATPAFRGFGLYPKTKPGQPDLYGTNIWGDLFYKLD